MKRTMQFSVKQIGKLVRFTVDGIIDDPGAEALNTRFRKLDIPNVKELVMDFKNVRYIGSSGVEKLLLFYKELNANGGRVRIENDNGNVHELFVVTKMHALLRATRNPPASRPTRVKTA